MYPIYHDNQNNQNSTTLFTKEEQLLIVEFSNFSGYLKNKVITSAIFFSYERFFMIRKFKNGKYKVYSINLYFYKYINFKKEVILLKEYNDIVSAINYIKMKIDQSFLRILDNSMGKRK